MTLDPTKPVRRRDGRPARIVCADAKGAWPILALHEIDDGRDELVAWHDAFGRVMGRLGDFDIVNVPVTVTVRPLAPRRAPEGYVTVPVEPTEAMRRAGTMAYWNGPAEDDNPHADMGLAWAAMLAASPAADARSGSVGGTGGAVLIDAIADTIGEVEGSHGDDRWHDLRAAQLVVERHGNALATSPVPGDGDGQAKLHKLVALIEELCDAVDREEVDIGGGRGSRTILREIVPLIRSAQAALATSPASSAPALVPGEGEGWRPTHRHVKRGYEYEVVGEAEAQVSTRMFNLGDTRPFRKLRDGDHLTVYRARDDKLWVRFTDEFNDGRFEPLPLPPTDTPTRPVSEGEA